MERLSMIELIEKVIVNRIDYDENGNEKSLDEMLVSALEISHRLKITVEAACALAWITFESSWGRQVDRQFLMSKLHEGSTIELRYRSLWILTASKLVRTYRNRQTPTLYFYLDREVCEAILSGKIELKNDLLINEHSNHRIIATTCGGESDDYQIMLDGQQSGYVIESAKGGYEVYWNGQLLFEHDDIGNILETLNDMLEHNRLPLSQK